MSDKKSKRSVVLELVMDDVNTTKVVSSTDLKMMTEGMTGRKFVVAKPETLAKSSVWGQIETPNIVRFHIYRGRHINLNNSPDTVIEIPEGGYHVAYQSKYKVEGKTIIRFYLDDVVDVSVENAEDDDKLPDKFSFLTLVNLSDAASNKIKMSIRQETSEGDTKVTVFTCFHYTAS